MSLNSDSLWGKWVLILLRLVELIYTTIGALTFVKVKVKTPKKYREKKIAYRFLCIPQLEDLLKM